MYCSSCGAEVTGGASFCSRCGARAGEGQTPGTAPPTGEAPVPPQRPGYVGGESPSIPTYLPYAILVTLFCCLPFGIPAIIYAARTSSRLAAGDIDGARADSKAAKMWTWVSFWAALVGWTLYGVFVLLVAVLGENG